MPTHKHYFPILTGKAGEFRALRELTPLVHSALTPILEVPPIDWDYENDVPGNSIDDQVIDFAQSVQSHWGTDLAFVDGYTVADAGAMASGVHAMTFIFDQARSLGLSLVPVTGLTRDAAYNAAVHGIVTTDRRGVCMRITLAELASPSFGADLGAALTALRLTPAETDFVLDMGSIEPQFERSYLMLAPLHLNAIPDLANWRTLVLGGSGFPPDLSSVTPSSTAAIRRLEWAIWSHLVTSGAFTRKPSFSDYSITNPQYPSLDFRFVKMSANIRYTHTDDWIIVKGTVIGKGKPTQYPSLARILRALTQYSGRAFSWGDAYIDDCASGAVGPGNATTWRQVGTNHHLTFVVQQLASHPGL